MQCYRCLSNHFLLVIAYCGGLFCLAGCESSIQQTTYPASGEVKLDGKPLAGAVIVLHAVDKTNFKWEELPQGVTDQNGKFNLFTYSSNDGAPAAEYTVGIALQQAVSDDGSDQVKREKNRVNLPTKFADPKKSGLTARVDAKATVIPTFELASK